MRLLGVWTADCTNAHLLLAPCIPRESITKVQFGLSLGLELGLGLEPGLGLELGLGLDLMAKSWLVELGLGLGLITKMKTRLESEIKRPVGREAVTGSRDS